MHVFQKEHVLEKRAEIFRKEGADGGSLKVKMVAKEDMVNELKTELRKKVAYIGDIVFGSSRLT